MTANEKLRAALVRLVDMPIADLRTEYAIALGITTASRWDDCRVTARFTRGEMVANIIDVMLNPEE